jgi:hypothetical protein
VEISTAIFVNPRIGLYIFQQTFVHCTFVLLFAVYRSTSFAQVYVIVLRHIAVATPCAWYFVIGIMNNHTQNKDDHELLVRCY